MQHAACSTGAPPPPHLHLSEPPEAAPLLCPLHPLAQRQHKGRQPVCGRGRATVCVCVCVCLSSGHRTAHSLASPCLAAWSQQQHGASSARLPQAPGFDSRPAVPASQAASLLSSCCCFPHPGLACTPRSAVAASSGSRLRRGGRGSGCGGWLRWAVGGGWLRGEVGGVIQCLIVGRK